MTAPLPSDDLEWSPVAVLPGIHMQGALGNEFVQLVGCNHDFILNLRHQFPKLDSFCHRFSDAFGEALEPSFVVMHRNFRHRHTDGQALLGFRNAVSLSVTLMSSATNLSHGGGFGSYRFSDSADFYPWMLGHDMVSLISSNASRLSFHDVDAFHGQPAPQVPQATLNADTGDAFLRDALLSCWSEAFVKRRRRKRNRSLFRSLEIAFEASRLPAAYFTSQFDVGRSVGLWISAHETCLNTGNAHVG
ncbi:hypothetical protein G5B38_17005 [Pseudohalocynthiibacter aestuariivivens]|nr:hypothetical protein [Pseudohalocynthiibacter aestuariivivens]QIE47086.1 hypothetical protein G5B38_17005 [Pseudohalocynthiibacter aestuariivivens]